MGMKYVLWEMRHIESSRKLTQQQIISSTRSVYSLQRLKSFLFFDFTQAIAEDKSDEWFAKHDQRMSH